MLFLRILHEGGGDKSWLHDFRNIFGGSEEVFYDGCHVYEKGNKIIAQKMLPYVLDAIKAKNEKKGENN